jgi:hypothetical protein
MQSVLRSLSHKEQIWSDSTPQRQHVEYDSWKTGTAQHSHPALFQNFGIAFLPSLYRKIGLIAHYVTFCNAGRPSGEQHPFVHSDEVTHGH